MAPSSRALARLITREISPATAPVLELGAGTGSFTRALVARGVKESDLTLIEYGEDFANLLRDRFPQARVLCMDASRLASHDLFPERKPGAAVSGLPLLSIPSETVEAILKATFFHLRPGAAFYQFTYGPRCPVSQGMLDRLGLKSERVGSTMRNLPPATVYRFVRLQPAGGQPAPARPGRAADGSTDEKMLVGAGVD